MINCAEIFIKMLDLLLSGHSNLTIILTLKLILRSIGQSEMYVWSLCQCCGRTENLEPLVGIQWTRNYLDGDCGM